MGGVWAPPLKLVDGVWFGVDGQWVGQATKFTSGQGYTRYDLPATAGLKLQRTDFAPDGRRAALFGLDADQPRGRRRTVTVKVDAHSELMGAYPWGFTGVTPNASDNIARPRRLHGRALQFTDDGALPARRSTTTRRSSAPTARRPRATAGGRTGGAYRGPQGATVPGRRPVGAERLRRRAVRQGHRRRAALQRHRARRGSRRCGSPSPARTRASAARGELAAALRDPAGELRRQGRARRKLRPPHRVSLPGRPAAAARDRLGQAEPRRPHAERASDLQIRWTNQGKQFPAPLGTVAQGALVRRRLPRLPVDLRHRRRVHRVRGDGARAVPDRRGPPAHAARHLRRAQRPLRDRRRTRRSPTARSGSATTRRPPTRRHQDERLQHRRDDQVPEHRRAHLALDRRRRASATTCTTSRSATCTRVDASSTWTRTAGPRARATSSAPAWAPRSSTTASTTCARCSTSPTWRGPSTTGRPTAWATNLADKLRKQFEGTWWAGAAAVRRLAHRPGQQAVLPEALDRPGADGGRARPAAAVTTPGVASQDHGDDGARRARELVLQRRPPGQPRALPHGLRRRPGRQGRLRDLLADDVDPGGRRGQLRPPGRRPAAALHRRQRRDDVLRAGDRRHARRAARRDAGDLPVGPHGDATTGIPANIDRCWTCRAMFMQAWGNYGTAWSVVHQQLGVRPDVGRGRSRSCRRCRRPGARRGSDDPARRAGRVAVEAPHAGSTTGPRQGRRADLDARDRPHAARGLEGRGGDARRQAVRHRHATTNRGVEVTVPTGARDAHAGGDGGVGEEETELSSRAAAAAAR